nr:asparaginase [Oceanococcus sp. HetDA_MAG_MS8]
MIQIFTTGGTIDKVYFDALSEFQIGNPQVGRVLADAGVADDYAVQSLLRKDSLELSDNDRAQLRDAVHACAASKVLITHGTDTMVETGLALSGIAGKTIVLVGAMQPAGLRVTDAEFNIGFAWAALQTLSEGVYIAMNGRIFDPHKARKNRDAHRFELAE